MAAIYLTRGCVTVIDDADYDLTFAKWFTNGSGYACRNVRVGSKRSTLLLHRHIMARVLGRDLLPCEEVDHIDGDRLNNHRENLRIADDSQNAVNRKVSSQNASGYKGVTKHWNKWRSRLRFEGKIVDLGLFPTAEEASEAYQRAAQQYYGERACTVKRTKRET